MLRPGDYPKNWKKVSRRVRFKRAGGFCERCRKQHGTVVWCGPLGSWVGDDGQWRDDRGNPIHRPPPWPDKVWYRNLWFYGEPPKLRRVKVILHAAHMNHDPADCHPANLMALCQSCHVRYDVPLHKWTRGVNADLARGQHVLFA